MAEETRAGRRRRRECPCWAPAGAGLATRLGRGPVAPGADGSWRSMSPRQAVGQTLRATPPAQSAPASGRRSAPRLLLNGAVSTFNSTSSQRNKGSLPITVQRPRASTEHCKSKVTGNRGMSTSSVTDAMCRATQAWRRWGGSPRPVVPACARRACSNRPASAAQRRAQRPTPSPSCPRRDTPPLAPGGPACRIPYDVGLQARVRYDLQPARCIDPHGNSPQAKPLRYGQ